MRRHVRLGLRFRRKPLTPKQKEKLKEFRKREREEMRAADKKCKEIRRAETTMLKAAIKWLSLKIDLRERPKTRLHFSRGR